MTSTTPLLAVVMIVKNESQHLARCLSSVRAVCDEIIVVDTGSIDDTVEIAESFGARVYHRVWNEDFAAARNESLEHTDAQWVLYIDADEMLVNVDVAQVRTMLTKANEVAAFGLQVSPMVGWLPYTDFRLWRHNPEIRFVGDIHETTMPDIRRLATERNQILQPIPLHIQHFGYEGDQTAKHLRNLPLLERQQQNTPRKINILGQIARIHFELGNFEEAETVWRNALAIIREDGEKEITDVTVFATYADLLMSQGIDADSVISEGKLLRSDYLVLHLAAAKNHAAVGRYAEAISEARILLSHAEKPPVDSRFAYNVQMFRLWPQQILAESLFQVGEYAEARFAFGNAVSMGMPYEQAQKRIRECEEFISEFTVRESSHISDSSDKVALTDATFLIPLRIDSGDRLRSIIATSGWLMRKFATTILIGHAEPEKIEPLLPNGVTVVKIHDNPHHPFHLTRFFNELSRHAITPVLIHYDVDVLVPPSQLIEAVQRVLDYSDELVIPYSYWHAIPDAEVENFLNSEITSHARFGWPRSLGDPVGGCVVQSSEQFLRVGMNNEYFIGWSSEDKERVERVITLGGTVSRVDGPLFHLEHDAVPQRPENRQFYFSGEAERHRLQQMSSDDLRNEVAAWPWTRETSPKNLVAADDLTITIPLRVETADRLRNAIVCTNSLLATTTARIIVGVHNPDDLREHFDELVELVPVNDDPQDLFHRTRILNELSRHVDTEFFANLDCDVCVSPKQWQSALALLRQNSADVVYPYDGEMVEIPHAYFPWLENGDFASLPLALRSRMHSDSVGGCVIWRMQTYVECGMENENFVSWGFEDDERFTRATALGARIHRVEGCVFHLQHSRGINSTPDHPMIENNEREYARIQGLSPDELRREIQQWPWCHVSTSH